MALSPLAVTYGETAQMVGKPLMSFGPWPDLYLNFYLFTCIMDPAYRLHGWRA